jgi:hypothetical protein
VSVTPLLTSVYRRRFSFAALMVVGAFLAGLLVNGAPADRGAVVSGADIEASAARKSEPTFRAASFNLLGWRHTAQGGKLAWMASGETRTVRAVELLNRHGISVAGFQEMQPQQHDRFVELVGSGWGLYPGNQLSRYSMHNSIGWRTAEWELVEANTVPIPYFNGEIVPMPYVLLRNHLTGRLVWFANFHNPANTKQYPNQQKWRDKATQIQVDLANKLWESGVPLVMTGDFNERLGYFCDITRLAPMRAANGGSWGNSQCAPPPDMGIDWIFASNFVKLSNYHSLRGYLVRRTTDHPLVVADVEVPVRARS